MPVEDVRAVEAAVGTMLVERGYSLSGYPSLTLTAARRRWLKARNFYGKLRFRISRFGMNLVFQDFLARRINIRPWKERVQLRLNDIERLHLK